MEIFSLVVGCFVIGLIARNIEPKVVQLVSPINRLIINFLFPLIVISTAPDIQLNQSSIFVFASYWLIALAFIPICIWVSNYFNLTRPEQGSLILLSILGNTAFLGIAMVSSLLGEDSIPLAVLYDQMSSFMLLSIVGTIVIAIYSNTDSNSTNNSLPSPFTIIKHILCFPPFLAFAASLFIPSTQSLGVLLPIFKLIGSAIVPLALIIIGLQIELRVEKRHRKALFAALGLKMLALPALTLAAALILGITTPQLEVSVIQAAMPPMVTPAIMLIQARIAPKFTASILGIGTLACFVTLPAWSYIVNYCI